VIRRANFKDLMKDFMAVSEIPLVPKSVGFVGLTPEIRGQTAA
jgi:hypothetical protein